MPTLVHIPFSPWSQRARWALALQRVPHEAVVYTPRLNEPWLRWKLGRPWASFTLPVLLRDDGPALLDSLDIAEWAAARSDNPLITDENRAEVQAWVARVERLLCAARVRVTERVLADPTAIREQVPPFLRFTGPVGEAMVRRIARDLLVKYGHLAPADPHAAMGEVLEAARDALRERSFLLGEHSFADLALATALAFVDPPAAPRVKLGRRSRELWRDPTLAAEFSDLLQWRDAQWTIYEAATR